MFVKTNTIKSVKFPEKDFTLVANQYNSIKEFSCF